MTAEARKSSSRKSAQHRRDDSGAAQRTVYAAAERYVAAGLSIIPIEADGTKAPCSELLPYEPARDGERPRPSWNPFRSRLPTRSELMAWFRPGHAETLCGIGVVCGVISGGLEVIDFDEIEAGLRWWTQLRKTNSKLLGKFALVMSPRPGLHVYYRCPEVGRSRKLAHGHRIKPDSDERQLVALVETRGEGSYIIAPPSPGQCHPSGRPYKLLSDRDLADVRTITSEERNLLITTAESLNEYVRPTRPRPPMRPPNPTKPYGGGRPGDDFNARADWGEILTPHGWQFVQELPDGTQHWCRPGKRSGTSATVNFEGSDLLYVFSSNAEPFVDQKGYSKFAAYALLNHRGDFTEAAQALRRKGYGRSIARSIVDPLRVYGQFVPRHSGSTG